MKKSFTFSLLFFLNIFFCLWAEEKISNQQIIQIGTTRQLFLDNSLISSLDGVSLDLKTPEDKGIILTMDEPWEGNTSGYNTVFKDGEIYRMYYRGWHHKGKAADHKELVCYAESNDGINWVKPDLGLVEFEGSKKNNIIWKGYGSHNFIPFLDSNPECNPKEKYKAVGGLGAGLRAFVSADGLNWQQVSNKPIITGYPFDSQNLVLYDESRKEYRAYVRSFKKGIRDIITMTSRDFKTWSKGEWLKYQDNVPSEHLYTNQIQMYNRVPGLFVGFPSRLSRGANVEGLFMSSQDGENFYRWGESIIRAGRNQDKWGNRSNYIWCGVVETKSDLPGAGNEISIYSGERYYKGPGGNVRRHTYRLDGFVSLKAPFLGGTAMTKPLVFEGNELELNYSTSAAGSIIVEVLGLNGALIKKSNVIWGDEISKTVITGLGQLNGNPVQLRFIMKDAYIYSIKFK